MRTLAFTVFGEPKAQGSKRALLHKTTQKPIVIESGGQGLRTWRQDVAGAAQAKLNGAGPFDGPVRLTVFFYVRQPRKPRNPLPITRPDVDKLLRSIMDGLEAGGIVRDDSQVVTLSVRKRYAETPRADVFLSEEAT